MALLATEPRRLSAHDPPVDILGGYKFPSAPTIDLSPVTTPETIPTIVSDWNPCWPGDGFGDDFWIPDFLRRPLPPKSEPAQAAE